MVDVRHADGKLDGIRISPRSKVDLRENMVVDERWQQLNPGIVKIVADQKPIQAMIPIPQTGVTISGEESKPEATAAKLTQGE
jgi:hypothetical protein